MRSVRAGKHCSPRGERCRAPIANGYWKTTSFVGALRLDGLTAPMALDGAMNSAVFLYLDDHLLAAVADLPEVRHTCCW